MCKVIVLGKAATLKEKMVSALCRENNFIILFPGYMWPKQLKIF